jgi:serine/threonine protein kinase
VVLQLLAGLGHAHEHGIVHRDVKPSNVFLPRGQPAKVMDFGVARLAGMGTTTTGVIVGTPNYMSPEQVAGGEIDGRSDLFSAGLILYELVTGEKAFRGDNLVSIVYKIAHESPDLGLIPGGREWEKLRGVLGRALAREASARYPDARAMAFDLGRALADLGGTGEWSAPADQALLVYRRPTPAGAPTLSPAPAPGPGSPRAPTRAPWFRPSALAAIVGGIAVVALAASWVSRRPSPLPPPPEPAAVAPTLAAHEVVPQPTATSLAAPSPSPSPTSTPGLPVATSTHPPPVATPTALVLVPAPGLSTDELLLRAEDLVARGRWAEALAEARAVLASDPRNARATALAQRAEEEQVVDECLGNARAALREGDRERAEKEVRRGFVIRKSDPRLLALFREVMQQP